jgi:hypothetical protein
VAFYRTAEQLGDRLRGELGGALKSHALVCYVCGDAQAKVVDLWNELRDGDTSLDTMMRLIELVSVLGVVTGKQHSGDAAEAVFAYGLGPRSISNPYHADTP